MPLRTTSLPSLRRTLCLVSALIMLISGCGSPAATSPEQASAPPTAALTDAAPTLPALSPMVLPPTDAAPTLPALSPTVLPPTDVPPVEATEPVPDPAADPSPADPLLPFDDAGGIVYSGDTVRSDTGFAFVAPDGWTGVSTYDATAGMQDIVLTPEGLGPDDTRPHGMILRAGPLTTLLSRTDPIGEAPTIQPPDPATITTPDDLLQAMITMAEDPTAFTNPQPMTIDGREGRIVDVTLSENGQVMAQGREAMVLLDGSGGLRIVIFMSPEQWDPAPFDALLASMTFFPPE